MRPLARPHGTVDRSEGGANVLSAKSRPRARALFGGGKGIAVSATSRSDRPAEAAIESKRRQATLTKESLTEDRSSEERRSTGEDLLAFAGTWDGDDFEDCLAAVVETRSLARF